MRFAVAQPAREIQTMKAAGAQHRRDLRTAALIATDRASKDGQRAVQAKIRAVGLGRLGNAVGHTSMKREGGASAGKDPYGVIFARGGDESLAGGALESYSRGATITAQRGRWLAYPTNAVPKYMRAGGRRRRTTPALYITGAGRGPATGALPGFGKLIFKPIGPNRAVLVFRRASVSIKTGRARAPTKRKSKASTNEKDVVAFVLIRVTRRAQRFDQRQEMGLYARRMPYYMQAALDEITSGRA